MILVSYVHLLCGDQARAAIALRRVPKDVSEQVYLTSLAAAADLADAADVRDAALERFCSEFKEKSPKSRKFISSSGTRLPPRSQTRWI